MPERHELQTAEALAAAMPPPLPVRVPITGPVDRELGRVLELLEPGERLTLSWDATQWEARTFDPAAPAKRCSETSFGDSLNEAIAGLLAVLA